METPHDLKTKPPIRNDYHAAFNDKQKVAGIRGFKEEMNPPRVAGIRGYSETPTKTPLVASTSELLESHPPLYHNPTLKLLRLTKIFCVFLSFRNPWSLG